MKTPREIVTALNRHVIGQDDAKKSVAIALRNRWRRRQLDPKLGIEVMPANILMIGPTGVGKTEVARRLAQLAGAPFIKVEATKFTEVGYVGRDVEAIIRELMEAAVSTEKRNREQQVREKAVDLVNERLVSLILQPEKARKKDKPARPGTGGFAASMPRPGMQALPLEIQRALCPDSIFPDQNNENNSAEDGEYVSETAESSVPYSEKRAKVKQDLLAGRLEDVMVQVEVTQKTGPTMEIFSSSGIEELGFNIGGLFGGMVGGRKEERNMKIRDAREVLLAEESAKLVDADETVRRARELVEEEGIVFLDEIDKIVSSGSSHGPDVSRQGVQRDLLPLVEGSTVITKYGPVRTDHILFIGAGAFHSVRPTDLIPELQGRFPIRVELGDLELEDYQRILIEPESSLLKQVKALLNADGVELEFTDDAVNDIAKFAWELNNSTSNIGARRLFTVMEKLVEEISFEAPDGISGKVIIDTAQVSEKLGDISKEEGISKYIL